jgi:hypothetical protein
MPSEYDFLLPYSRRLRRTGAVVMGAGAFLAGVACMATIIALPLRPHPTGEKQVTPVTARTSLTAEQKPVAPAPKVVEPVAQASAATERRDTVEAAARTASATEGSAPSPAAPSSASQSASDAAAAANATAPSASAPSQAKPKTAERRKSRSSQAQAYRREQKRRYARSQDEDPRREFGDDNGARYGFAPRPWGDYRSERDYRDSAFAYDREPSRRPYIFRQRPFFDRDD